MLREVPLNNATCEMCLNYKFDEKKAIGKCRINRIKKIKPNTPACKRYCQGL